MKRIAILIASAAINASTIPAVAAECTSIKHVGTSCARLATVNSKQVDAADNEKICRAYAASFYESVMLRQASASRVDGASALAALDSVINAFNDLLATKCGG
jgi:hypothetical protein